MFQCPGCKSHGAYPIKRHWWQRLFKLPHRYHCFDCAQDFDHTKVETRSGLNSL